MRNFFFLGSLLLLGSAFSAGCSSSSLSVGADDGGNPPQGDGGGSPDTAGGGDGAGGDGGGGNACTAVGGYCEVVFATADGNYSCRPGFAPSQASCGPAGGDCCAPVVGGGDGGGILCTASSDCPSGQLCGFLESGGCSATTGQCFPTGALCNSFFPGCACDGTTIDIACEGLPNGYSIKPLAHMGACADGGGTGPACATSGDCRLFSDYCNNGCTCDVLGPNDPNPVCEGGSNCLVDPCQGHAAVCDGTGHCVLQ